MRQFCFTNNNVLLFFTLILYPIFIVYFRILTSFKRKIQKTSTQIILICTITICIIIVSITGCFVKAKSIQKSTNKNNEYVIKASKKDSVKFNYSDKKVFDDLSKIMKSYVLQIQDNENQNEKLAELRDSLLPKLMNGEIEVDKVKI